MPELLAQRPKMRYIFTGGKGGVGKTVAAAGLAYHYAAQGERVLLASLNPVHSLSSLFGQSLSGGKVVQVQGAEGVHAFEVETTEVVERYPDSIRGRGLAGARLQPARTGQRTCGPPVRVAGPARRDGDRAGDGGARPRGHHAPDVRARGVRGARLRRGPAHPAVAYRPGSALVAPGL